MAEYIIVTYIKKRGKRARPSGRRTSGLANAHFASFSPNLFVACSSQENREQRGREKEREKERRAKGAEPIRRRCSGGAEPPCGTRQTVQCCGARQRQLFSESIQRSREAPTSVDLAVRNAALIIRILHGVAWGEQRGKEPHDESTESKSLLREFLRRVSPIWESQKRKGD